MDICNYPKRDLFIRIGLKYPFAGYYLRWYYNGWHYWHFLPGEQVLMTQGENYRTTGKKKITLGTGNITSDQVTSIKNLLLTKQVQIYTESGWVSVFIDPSSMIIYDHEVNGYEVELTITIGSKEISYLSGYSPVVYVPDVPASADPDICEVIIGTQIWMCKNYASNFPGSKVYNNDESYRDIYGGLYKWDHVMTPGFCPTGWRVPTEADWQTLITFLGGDAVAGGHLKEIGTDHWQTPNTGADDSSGFTALGGGDFNRWTFTFENLKQHGYFWTSTEDDVSNAMMVDMLYNAATATLLSAIKDYYFSVRLIKDALTYNDWYLPSQDELKAMHDNLHAHGVGGFADNFYWSSSEHNNIQAKEITFLTGYIGFASKTNTFRARACRSFMSGIGAYSLRDVGPAGGLIFYIDGTTYYEAAPSDQSTGIVWSNITNVLIGTTGTAIGTGKQNTLDIIGQAGHANSAAKLCNDLEIYV